MLVLTEAAGVSALNEAAGAETATLLRRDDSLTRALRPSGSASVLCKIQLVFTTKIVVDFIDDVLGTLFRHPVYVCMYIYYKELLFSGLWPSVRLFPLIVRCRVCL